MDRRTFIGGVASGLLAVPFAAEAQQAARLPRIGVLFAGNTGTGTEVLREGLRELGYVEGRTAVIEWRWWEGKPERLRDAVAEMVRLNLDVIVVGGSEATKAMKDATRTIPIVFFGPSYPVEEGLVESFARPGGNITGVTVAQSDFGEATSAAAGCRPGTLRRRRHLEPGQFRTYFSPQGHRSGGSRPEAEGSVGAHGQRR